jgi:mannitol/fructose-specific phosphotransferase system IIA component (Ntr-type)
MLANYLTPDTILLRFEAPDFEHALNRMLAVSSVKNQPEIIEQLLEREALMPTTVGKGIALPRVLLEDIHKSELIIAISHQGIPAMSLDRLPIKLVFLFLFSKTADYASILAQGLRMLNDSAFQSELLQAQRPEDVMRAIREWEKE